MYPIEELELEELKIQAFANSVEKLYTKIFTVKLHNICNLLKISRGERMGQAMLKEGVSTVKHELGIDESSYITF